MYICVLTVPSNKIYGFDGVTDEEFKVFHSNVDKILNQTGLGFDEEINKGTDSSAYLWSDADEFSFYPAISGTEFEANDEDDEIVNISDEFFNQVQCGYDLFVELNPETLNDAIETVRNILAPYSLEAISS